MEEKTTEKHESMKKDHQQTVCLSTVWDNVPVTGTLSINLYLAWPLLKEMERAI